MANIIHTLKAYDIDKVLPITINYQRHKTILVIMSIFILQKNIDGETITKKH